jgi:molybdopterin-guanine dinucleotide biosynthesis protein B
MNMKCFGVVGRSGSGKTALISRLLPEFNARDVTVSTIKHTHHFIDIDKPGKDSYIHRESGAREVMLASPRRWALVHERRDGERESLEELITHMTPVDLLLIEGFRGGEHDKIEVYRPSTKKPRMYSGTERIVAVASDEPLAGEEVPVLDLNDTANIVTFILDHCSLTGK